MKKVLIVEDDILAAELDCAEMETKGIKKRKAETMTCCFSTSCFRE